MQTPTSCSSKGESTAKRCIDSTTKLPLEKPSKIPKTEEESESLSSSEEEAEEDQKLMVKNPRAQRYIVAIEYIGTRFCGSQKQPNCRTVVGALEKAFLQFIGQPVSVSISSRTDAGVHALSNVCHVDVERISKRKPGEVLPAHEPGVVRRAVNHFLQKNEGDITVIDVRCIPSDFHARFRALERTYFYRLLSGPEHVSTFERDRAWHVPEDLDLASMQNACKVLVGSHDFSSFRAAGCQAKSPIRTLDELSISEVASNPYFPSVVERGQSSSIEQDLQNCSCSSETKLSIDGSVPNSDIAEGFSTSHGQGFGQLRSHRSFVVKARARAFLYHQVRLLVGVLKCAGTGNLTTEDVERILNAKDVAAACPMAPAYGLYLGNVKYDLP